MRHLSLRRACNAQSINSLFPDYGAKRSTGRRKLSGAPGAYRCESMEMQYSTFFSIYKSHYTSLWILLSVCMFCQVVLIYLHHFENWRLPKARFRHEVDVGWDVGVQRVIRKIGESVRVVLGAGEAPGPGKKCDCLMRSG